jgi:hypothetical protein
MAKNKTINVKGTEITLFSEGANDYISLTDIARYKDAVNTDDIIKNWLRNRNTIELLGFWESMYNPKFKPVEFDGFKKQAGLNSFVMTPKKWIETTNAIDIRSKLRSYSIKLVLPERITELTYDDLAIGNGGDASAAFLTCLKKPIPNK